MNNKNEYILCAAIHYKDGGSYPHQPKNVDSGLVMAGRRHSDCIAMLSLLNGYNKSLVGRDAQGFLTSHNRWVSRSEAYLIAKAAGQLLHNLHDPANPILISEDLY